MACTDARMKLTTEVIPACCSLKMLGKKQRFFPASPCSAETVACLACQRCNRKLHQQAPGKIQAADVACTDARMKLTTEVIP